MRTQIGPQMVHMLCMATLGLMLSLAASAQAKPSIPPHGKLAPLFNGKDLTGFDTLLEKQGINSDPNKVFQVEKGVLHISGQEFGGLVTQKEYENYYLRAEFKWGEKTYPPRDGKARDSGIQYNITGTAQSLAADDGVSDQRRRHRRHVVVGGTGATVDGKVYESTSSGPGAYIRIPHIGRGPLVNVTGHLDPVNDLERPHGKWNVLELVVDHDRVTYFVNGKLAILGMNANTTKGRILFQCEGAEVYFRNMKIAILR